MKTSYYLVAAAGLTAVGFLYVKRPTPAPPAAPLLPVAADPVGPPPPDPWAEPPLAAAVDLPPIPAPSAPEAPLVIPASVSLPVPIPTPASPPPPPLPVPDVPPPALPAVPAVEPPAVPPPAVPAVPEPPAPPPVKLPEPPAVPAPPITPEPPAVPPTPVLPPPPTAPSLPSTPTVPPPPVAAPTPPPLPEPPAAKPVEPVLPKPIDAPPVVPVQPPPPPATTPPPVVPAQPPSPPVVPPPQPQPLPAPEPVPAPAKPAAQLPAPTPLPAEGGAPPGAGGKFVILKGHKLIEGAVTVTADQVIVRQGSLDRPFPKSEVLQVAETRDDVYQFMLGRVKADDPVARLAVARWCMYSGLREQALTEAREVLRLRPGDTTAADMARSLEESLKLFPADGSAPVVAAKPAEGRLVTTGAVADVTPEGASSFATRAQPVLANQCMECHARPDHPGAFKLTRVTGYEAGPHTTNANLRAAAGQLKKDDPLRSPLLAKALTAHGPMKEPAFANRQVPAYRALEAWVLLAAGPPVRPMDPPVPPALPPQAPNPPRNTATVPPPVVEPADPPALPPVEPTLPAVPPPAAPTPTTVPPVLPTPPSIPPAAPSGLPAVPPIPVIPADPDPQLPTVPAIPVIPPAASELPKPPVAGAGQFGTSAPPKPPATQPNTQGDEFDPEVFNKTGK